MIFCDIDALHGAFLLAPRDPRAIMADLLVVVDGGLLLLVIYIALFNFMSFEPVYHF